MADTGLVLSGSNNLYAVQIGKQRSICHFKGKRLKNAENEHNPLAPGDIVIVDSGSNAILGRRPRRNRLARWLAKRQTPQTLAVNLDLAVIVASAGLPPFRPRFIDRVIIQALPAIEPVVVLNKIDQGVGEEAEKRLTDFRRMGYKVFRLSALNGSGLNWLKDYLKGKNCALIGQSGVGKSTLLNALEPKFNRLVGEISVKYRRGRHTTSSSVLLPWAGGSLIDTPGLREIALYGIDKNSIADFMPDLSAFSDQCRLPGCLHWQEPDCAIKQAVADGLIHPDRYASYMGIYGDLKKREERKIWTKKPVRP